MFKKIRDNPTHTALAIDADFGTTPTPWTPAPEDVM